MKKGKLTIEDLVALAQSGDSHAAEEVIVYFENQIEKIININQYYLKGGDNNDLMQRGREAVFNAIKKYDCNHPTRSKFITFASACIRNSLKTAIDEEINVPLNYSDPLSDEVDKNNIVADNRFNPEDNAIIKETEQEIDFKVKEKLSIFEYRVYQLRKNGYKNSDISKELNCEIKAIENAYSRIKIKLTETKNSIKKEKRI